MSTPPCRLLIAALLFASVPLLAPAPSSAGDEDPRLASLRAFHKELVKAVRTGKMGPLQSAWEPVAKAAGQELNGETLAQLREMLKANFKGRAAFECRGWSCQIERFPAPGESFAIELRQVDGRWVVHSPAATIGHLGVQVSANLSVSGPGQLRVLVNGERSFLFDDLEDTSVTLSAIDDALVAGANTVELVPLGLKEGAALEASIQIGAHPTEGVIDSRADDLLSWSGQLSEARSWTVTVGEAEAASPSPGADPPTP